VVVEKGKPVGIITERDILKRVVLAKQNPAKTTVSDVMTRQLITADVNSRIIDVSRTMEKNRFRRLPVTEKGKLIGIITSKDIIKIMSA
jgi:CBS domain-containing protein